MESAEYARIAAVEDDHWWYRNTRGVMNDLLALWLPGAHTILDAGCGPGGNGAWLNQHGTVVGVDLSTDALQFVRTQRAETIPVRANVEYLPFATGSFDIALSITVLYTVHDDRRAIGELARVTRPGGVVLLMEPAFRWLERAHDKTVHSQRRYRRKELADLFALHGFRVARSTYVYSFLVPPAAVLALAERVRPHATAKAGSDVDRRALDGAFARLAKWERSWITRHDVPLGTTAALVAVREE